VPRGCGADLTEAVPSFAGGQHRQGQIEHGRAHAHHLGMLCVDDHAVAGGQVTRGGRAAHALDVHEARAAGAERRAIGILAELWQRDVEAVDGLEHRRATRELDAPAVDGDDHARSMIPNCSGNSVSPESTASGAA
jgi:hypothetical protein